MKKIVLFLICLTCTFYVAAQKTYTVDGKSYELKTEVDGTIDLLWNIIDGQYRYFVMKDDTITELTNTKDTGRKYNEEYKTVLKELTSDTNISTEPLKLTLYSLRKFFDSYNSQVDPNYIETDKEAKLQGRLLIFGGITNSPFVDNPENKSNPLFGVEFELFERNDTPRHSLLFQIKHTLSSDEFKYSNTQLGLGYRFRIISQPGLSIYATLLGATYGFSNNEFVLEDQIIEESGNSFDVPFIFGVGTDIRITENSYITLAYDELFGLFIDNQGNFSTHLSVGYKMNL